MATLLTETHDLLLANLASFRFFNAAFVGERVVYLNLFDALETEGLEGVISVMRRVTREAESSLLILDGATILKDVAASPLALRRFAQQVQAQAAVLVATTLLLAGQDQDELGIIGAHVDGILMLANERNDSHHVRRLEVLKLRGGFSCNGATHVRYRREWAHRLSPPGISGRLAPAAGTCAFT